MNTPPHEQNEHREKLEAFAEFAAEYEGKKEKGVKLSGHTVWFSASMVALMIGAAWGVAISFNGFLERQAANTHDIARLFRIMARTQNDTMSLKEMDLWATAAKTQNPEIVVPLPSDYKVKRPSDDE